MPRFFVRANQIENGTAQIFGDDAHHISRSLRMAVGEHISVCDMQKNIYECELTEFLSDRVCAKVLSCAQSDVEPPFHAHLYQALPKGDKLDSIIQKAVECGMSEMTTFESERCVVRMKEGTEQKKLERRERIALEAAKQSGRGLVPKISPTVDFKTAIDRAANADIRLFCYEGDDTSPLATVLKEYEIAVGKNQNPTISIVIGSEGGFSLSEVQYAREKGLIPVGLGKRILRTETAASFVLSCLVYHFELGC